MEDENAVVPRPVRWKTLRGPLPDIPAWVKVPPPPQDGSNPDAMTAGQLQARAQHRARYAAYIKQQHSLHFAQPVMWENGPEFQLGITRDNGRDKAAADFDYN